MSTPKTVRELLAASYANLAMAHYAVERGDQKFTRTAYSIRARLAKGLRTGDMSVGSLVDDERLKLLQRGRCTYCDSADRFVLDHLIPRVKGGRDTGDNLVPACRECNSSKGGKDVLVWFQVRGTFPPLMVLRRYLKLAIQLCAEAGVIDAPLDSCDVARVPIAFASIPVAPFPQPSLLRL